MVVKRTDFRNCEIFTSERSLQSIVESIGEVITPKTEEIYILDAFCGDGIVGEIVLRYLARSEIKYSLTFADNNPAVLNEEKMKEAHCQRRVCDLTKTNNLGLFHLITVRYGLHDLSYEDKEKAIKCLSEMIVPGGAIVLCDIMPDVRIRTELTKHHQVKEDLCDGSNKEVYLSTSGEYIQSLKRNKVDAKLRDFFLQEVYLRNWLGTLGVDSRTIKRYENFTVGLSSELKDYCHVFEHHTKGVKMYYPVGTVLGVKK